MKVSKLIKLLKRENPDKLVVIPGYEVGYSDVKCINKIKLSLNVNDEWCYGDHEQDDENGDTDAILIS